MFGIYSMILILNSSTIFAMVPGLTDPSEWRARDSKGSGSRDYVNVWRPVP